MADEIGSGEPHHLPDPLTVSAPIAVLGTYFTARLGIEGAEQPLGGSMHQEPAAAFAQLHPCIVHHGGELPLSLEGLSGEIVMSISAEYLYELHEEPDILFRPGEIQAALHHVNFARYFVVQSIRFLDLRHLFHPGKNRDGSNTHFEGYVDTGLLMYAKIMSYCLVVLNNTCHSRESGNPVS